MDTRGIIGLRRKFKGQNGDIKESKEFKE